MPRKLKIDVAHGSYIIDSREDVLSLRIEVTRDNKAELYRRLTYHQDRLIRAGKLDGMMWIRDIEEELDEFKRVRVTRQWAKCDATTFIPTKEE